MDIKWIKEQVQKGNYQLKLHALERASARQIDPLEIKEALLNGQIIEDYPDDKRGHSCLIQGKSLGGKDIHLVSKANHHRFHLKIFTRLRSLPLK